MQKNQQDQAVNFIASLYKHRHLIALAYDNALYETEENTKEIRQMMAERLLIEFDHDEYRLKSSLKSLISTQLNHVRAMQQLSGFGDLFEGLGDKINAYVRENNANDKEILKDVVIEIIIDIASALEDDIKRMDALVATEFATSPILDKRLENEWYHKKISDLIKVLESFIDANYQELLIGDVDLYRIYSRWIKSKISDHLTTLKNIIQAIDHNLYKIRVIQENLNRFNKVYQFLNKTKSWEPSTNIDALTEIPAFLTYAQPMKTVVHPDIFDPLHEELNSDIASIIKPIEHKDKPRKEISRVDSQSIILESQVYEEPFYKKLLHDYFKHINRTQSVGPISAIRFKQEDVDQLFTELTMTDRHWVTVVINASMDEAYRAYDFHYVTKDNALFNGNIIVEDVQSSRKVSAVLVN